MKRQSDQRVKLQAISSRRYIRDTRDCITIRRGCAAGSAAYEPFGWHAGSASTALICIKAALRQAAESPPRSGHAGWSQAAGDVTCSASPLSSRLHTPHIPAVICGFGRAPSAMTPVRARFAYRIGHLRSSQQRPALSEIQIVARAYHACGSYPPSLRQSHQL